MRHESDRVVAPVRRAKGNNGDNQQLSWQRANPLLTAIVKGARVCRLAQEIVVSKPASYQPVVQVGNFVL